MIKNLIVSCFISFSLLIKFAFAFPANWSTPPTEIKAIIEAIGEVYESDFTVDPPSISTSGALSPAIINEYLNQQGVHPVMVVIGQGYISFVMGVPSETAENQYVAPSEKQRKVLYNLIDR